MKIISHRGNIKGTLPEKENRPSYIDCAIGLQYDVEIDIRFIDNYFWLGHDKPQYKVEIKWLQQRKNNLWIHCKNVDAALQISKLNDEYIYFCHSNDPYVVISNNKIWCHEINNFINNNCVIPLIKIQDIEKYEFSQPYGICTDYPSTVLKDWKKKCKL